MGFFNQNDFKYIIKRIIIILGVLIIASMFRKVFGYTNFNAPNGKTYRIPDYTPTYDKHIVFVWQNKNSNWYYVKYYDSNADFIYASQSPNSGYLCFRSGNNLDQNCNITYKNYSAQSLSSAGTWSETQNPNVNNYSTPFINNSYDIFIYDCNFTLDLYTTNPKNGSIVSNIYTPPIVDIDPYIENNSTDIEDWSFENLSINYGTITYDRRDYLRVTYFDSNTGQNYGDFDLNLSLYADTIGAGVLVNPINIPQQRLNNTIVFKENFKIGFILVHFTDEQGNTQNYTLSDSPYTVSISSSYVNDLNNNADRNIQNDILNQTEENNKQLQDLNDSITSSDIDEDAIAFPTIDVQDGGVLNAMSSFFDKIYNAFTNGTLLDIVIPIPFTERNIVIPYDYTATQLRNANASWIIDIIQLGWWYIIGRYIIINLFEKVIMLMRGSVDRIQMNNITTKLL